MAAHKRAGHETAGGAGTKPGGEEVLEGQSDHWLTPVLPHELEGWSENWLTPVLPHELEGRSGHWLTPSLLMGWRD